MIIVNKIIYYLPYADKCFIFFSNMAVIKLKTIKNNLNT